MVSIEIYEAAIDQARDNPASLRQLSLTCRAFLPRSRYHLFHTIVLRTVEQMQSSSKFLDTCPWVLPLVQKVALLGTPRRDVDTGSHVTNIPLLHSVPVDLLIRLPNVRQWKISQASEAGSGSEGPYLSLHRSVLSYYQKLGGNIVDLELSSVSFYSISDFIGLVSQITGLQHLRCGSISFRTKKGPNPALYGSGRTMLFKMLALRNLHVDKLVDTRAVEYLLASSAATLNHLTMGVMATADDFDGYRGLITHRIIFTNQLGRVMGHLSQLVSLTVSIHCLRFFPKESQIGAARDLTRDIQCAIRILAHVSRDNIRDVHIQFALDPVARFGTCLSEAGTPLEACEALQEALLTFPRPRIVLRHNPGRMGRAGRAAFWLPIIKQAFKDMDERGFVTSIHTVRDTPDPRGHEDQVTCLIASLDSKWAVTASLDGTIIIWDMSCGAVLQEWVAHRGPIHALSLSPNGRQLVSAGGSDGQTLVVWGVGNDAVHRVASIEDTQMVTDVAWSPDGALIATACEDSEDGVVHVWDTRTLQRDHSFDRLCRTPEPKRSRFSPDMYYLAWKAAECSGVPLGSQRTIWTLLLARRAVPPSRRQRLLGPFQGDDFCAPIEERARNPPLVFDIDALAFDPERRRIAIASSNKFLPPSVGERYPVRVMDPATGVVLAVQEGHTKPVLDVSFSPDGRFVLSASADGSTKLYSH